MHLTLLLAATGTYEEASAFDETHVVPQSGVAVQRVHRLHQPVHPLRVPRRLRRPLRHRHPGPIDEALAYQARVGNRMEWYSTANSPFGSDMGAPPNGGFHLNVFLRVGDTAYRTYNTQGSVEQVSHTFPLIDLLPYGRQGVWQDSPAGWPQSPTYSKWADSVDYARYADNSAKA